MAAAKLTLFAYVQGADLENVVAAIEPRLDALVAGRKWVSPDVWVVNQQEPPHWDLGLNLSLSGSRSAEWTEDVIAITKSFAELHRETGRSFVIGFQDGKTETTKDLFVVDTSTPDLAALRTALDAMK